MVVPSQYSWDEIDCRQWTQLWGYLWGPFLAFSPGVVYTNTKDQETAKMKTTCSTRDGKNRWLKYFIVRGWEMIDVHYFDVLCSVLLRGSFILPETVESLHYSYLMLHWAFDNQSSDMVSEAYCDHIHPSSRKGMCTCKWCKDNISIESDMDTDRNIQLSKCVAHLHCLIRRINTDWIIPWNYKPLHMGSSRSHSDLRQICRDNNSNPNNDQIYNWTTTNYNW